ncbi:MAG: type secretion system lipoprotein TssJ [Pseudomonadota bacterium]|jgi:type VI secretion system protein VasD
MPPTTLPRKLSALLCTVAVALSMLTGCETASKLGEGFGNMGDKALETIGFKKPEPPPLPEVPEAAKPARALKVTVMASDSLNVDASGRSLSLVVRVFKLRGTTAFLAAPAGIFGHPAKEKEVLGDELIDSREVVLIAGQQQQLAERWAREATHVGVVALFRNPSANRWRYAFDMDRIGIADTKVVLGAHACSLSVAAGSPVGVSPAALKLAPRTCNPD